LLTTISNHVLVVNTRMTAARLRMLYTFYEVAERDIPSLAIRDLMNLSLGSHALAAEYIRIRVISLMTIDVRGDNDQLGGRISELTFPSGGYDYSPRRVNHPGDPLPGGVVVTVAGNKVVFVHHDVDGVAVAGNQVVLAHHDVDSVAASGNQEVVLAHHDVDSVAAPGNQVGLSRNNVADDNAGDNSITRVHRGFVEGPPIDPGNDIFRFPADIFRRMPDGGLRGIDTFSVPESQGEKKNKKGRKE
jgi:hypothetical protein